MLRLYKVCPNYDDFYIRVFISEDCCFFVPNGYTFDDINDIIKEYNQKKRKISFYKSKLCSSDIYYDIK